MPAPGFFFQKPGAVTVGERGGVDGGVWKSLVDQPRNARRRKSPLQQFPASSLPTQLRYHVGMPNDEQKHELSPELERYLALCERLFERMVETGEWPWRDSPDFGDVVESKPNPHKK